MNTTVKKNTAACESLQSLITSASALSNGVLMAIVVYTLFKGIIALMPENLNALNYTRNAFPEHALMILSILAGSFGIISGISNTLLLLSDRKNAAHATASTSTACAIMALLAMALLGGAFGVVGMPLTVCMICAAFSSLFAWISFRNYEEMVSMEKLSLQA